jgi:hypothetical protein
MGQEFVTALFKVFHEVNMFLLQHPKGIERFLKVDRFDTGCVPAKYVRHIKVLISLRHFNTETGNVLSWSSPTYDSPLQRHYDKALGGLKFLESVTIPRKATLVLHV